jgi:hypothetical protein
MEQGQEETHVMKKCAKGSDKERGNMAKKKRESDLKSSF